MKTSPLLIVAGTGLLALALPHAARAQAQKAPAKASAKTVAPALTGPRVVSSTNQKHDTHYDVSNPEMTSQATEAHLKGDGVLQAEFDAKGKVSKATMTKSTGSGILDANAIAWAKRNWKATPGNTSVVDVPIRMGTSSKSARSAYSGPMGAPGE